MSPRHQVGLPRTEASARRPDASMSLLNDLMRDPGTTEYLQASQRSGTTVPDVVQRSVVAIVAIALGLLVSGAVVDLRAPVAALERSRAVLVAEIAERSTRADDLAAKVDSLSSEISDLQEQALASDNPQLLADLAAVELVSGASAVTGPGLTVELADAQDVLSDDPLNRVQDIDLQIVVNGLWAAGAEAVSVNGQRLTSLSTIRHVQQAILVDLVPLSSPYTVSAIGDTQPMQIEFSRGPAAGHLAILTSRYGISAQVSGAENLVLPGAGPSVLRYATTADVASSTGQKESP